MSTRPWIFISNPFDTATKETFIGAFTLSTHLDAALNQAKADAAILVLYNFYHPIHTAYVAAYNAWNVQGGTQKGSTQNLTNLLDGLTAKINAWDYAITGYAAKGSPNYIALLPNGHAPFTKGNQSSRISAVESLDIALTGIVPLATTKTDVHNYSVLLDGANTTQKGNKTSTGANSDSLELQRIAMCQAQMYVYGGLVQKYYTQLDKVGNFYDMDILRHIEQSTFTGTAKANSNTNIAKRTLPTTAQITLTNNGLVPLQFYIATQATDAPTAPLVDVAPNDTHTVAITALGDPTTQHYINVQNLDPPT